MQNLDSINKLRDLLIRNKTTVSEVELISDNYDDFGNLIHEQVPTLTTDFCEIGIYENYYYFTLILNSKLFSQTFFKETRKFENVHFYGFKNFKDDYYPAESFDYTIFEKQIRSEEYFQIQFNFMTKDYLPNDIKNELYLIIKKFNDLKITPVNQLKTNLTQNLKPSH